MQLLLTLVIAPPLLAAFVYILLHSGPYVALYLWGFVFAVSMLFMTLYPSLIAPLFNKFDPLPEGALRCGSIPGLCTAQQGSQADACCVECTGDF